MFQLGNWDKAKFCFSREIGYSRFLQVDGLLIVRTSLRLWNQLSYIAFLFFFFFFFFLAYWYSSDINQGFDTWHLLFMTLLAVVIKTCLGLEWHVNNILLKLLTVVKTELQVQVDGLLTIMSPKVVEGIKYT